MSAHAAAWMVRLVHLVIGVVMWTLGAAAAQPSATDASLHECATSREPVRASQACAAVVEARVWDSGIRLPAVALFYERLGRALESSREWDTALRVYRDGLRQFPANGELNYLLGRLLLNEIATPVEALGPLSEAVRVMPANGDARLAYADALRLMGRSHAAIVEYRSAIDLQQRSAEARFGLGVSLGRQGRLDAAVKELKLALALRSEWWEARRELVHALRRANREREGVALLREAIQKNVGPPREVHCELAVALKSLGEIAAAREECRLAHGAPALQHGAQCQCSEAQ